MKNFASWASFLCLIHCTLLPLVLIFLPTTALYLMLDSKIEFNESIFSKLSARFTHFSDSYSSSENRFFVKPTFTVDVMDQAIKTNVIVDHVSGSFKNNYFFNHLVR